MAVRELVNRLYVTKGWISSTWQGNGGRSSKSARNSMFDEAPSSLQKQAQGSITYVSPGDVVSVNVMDGSAFEPDGHVLIISGVSGSNVTYVSQNAGSNTARTVTTYGQLGTNGDFTVKASNWTYPVIGVVHAPQSGPSGLLHFVYYVGSDGVLRVDHWNGSVWQNDDLGVAVEADTSPSAYLGSGGTDSVSTSAVTESCASSLERLGLAERRSGRSRRGGHEPERLPGLRRTTSCTTSAVTESCASITGTARSGRTTIWA